MRMAKSKFSIFLLIITFIFAAAGGGALAYFTTTEAEPETAEVVAAQPEKPEPVVKEAVVEKAVAETPVVVDATLETEPEEQQDPETEAEPEETAKSEYPETDVQYWVVLGSNESLEESNMLVDKLQDSGFVTSVGEERGMYEVRMGPYIDFAEGEAIAASMSQVDIITDEVEVRIELKR